MGADLFSSLCLGVRASETSASYLGHPSTVGIFRSFEETQEVEGPSVTPSPQDAVRRLAFLSFLQRISGRLQGSPMSRLVEVSSNLSCKYWLKDRRETSFTV